MSVHFMHLDTLPFDMIQNGTKTIELRLFDEKRRKLRIGDSIIFSDSNNTERKMTVRVLQLHRFPSFASLYQSLPLLSCGYTPENVANANANDMNDYYSPEMQQKYGVVGIEIEVINR